MNYKNLYTIKRGDSFWSLENEWNMPHGTLQKLNPNLDPKKLQINSKIEIVMPTIIYLVAEQIPQEPKYKNRDFIFNERKIDNLRVDNILSPLDHINEFDCTEFGSNLDLSFNNQTNNFFKQTTSGLITARKVFSLENIRRTGLLRSNELWHFQKNGTVTHPWKRMSNGASHWKNNIVVNHRRTFMGISSSRAIAPTALRFAGKFLLAADVGLSGEIKPSHVVTACLIGSSSTGVGAIFAGVYFIADIGTGLITGNSISQRLDGWVSSNYGKLELYEGLY